MFVMILNDDTTFTNLEGCRIVDVGDAVDVSVAELKVAPSLLSFSEEDGHPVINKEPAWKAVIFR